MPNLRRKAKIELPAGISYRDVAADLGVNHSHLWHVCQGTRRSDRLERRVRDWIARHEKRVAATAA